METHDLREKLEFCHRDGPVGLFMTAEYPREPGPYRYMPYRGRGHYSMQEELRNGRVPCCSYEAGGEHVYFAVVDCPEYGVLVLADFSSGKPHGRFGPHIRRGPESTSTSDR